MVLHRNTGISMKYKDAEYDEDNENYEDNITWKHKTIRQNTFVGMEEDLDDEDNVDSKVKNVVT